MKGRGKRVKIKAVLSGMIPVIVVGLSPYPVSPLPFQLTHEVDDFSRGGRSSSEGAEIQTLPVDGRDEGRAEPHTWEPQK